AGGFLFSLLSFHRYLDCVWMEGIVGGLGVDVCRDHICLTVASFSFLLLERMVATPTGHGVGTFGRFGFYLFYVKPVGDVCLPMGRALGGLMVLFLGGRAGMTRSLIMSLTIDLVSSELVVYASMAGSDWISSMPV